MASYNADGSAVYEQGEYEGNAFGATDDLDAFAASQRAYAEMEAANDTYEIDYENPDAATIEGLHQ